MWMLSSTSGSLWQRVVATHHSQVKDLDADWCSLIMTFRPHLRRRNL